MEKKTRLGPQEADEVALSRIWKGCLNPAPSLFSSCSLGPAAPGQMPVIPHRAVKHIWIHREAFCQPLQVETPQSHTLGYQVGFQPVCTASPHTAGHTVPRWESHQQCLQEILLVT